MLAPSAVPAATVLLIEDEPYVLRLLTAVLSRAGYAVLTAASGEEGLRHFDGSNQIDLVITDLVMPGMSGQDVASRLQQVSPATKVLLMSGYSDRVHDLSPLRYEVLPKPCTPRQMLDTVARTLSVPASVG